MMNKTEFKLKLYPFIAGIAPILVLFTGNLGEVEFSEVWRSLLSAILLTAFALLVTWLVFRNWSKAGLLTSIVMISILSYGHVYDGLKEIEVLIPFARHRFLLVLNVLFILGFGWLLWKKIKNTQPLELFFTWFCVFMLVFPSYTLARYYLFSNIETVNTSVISQSGSVISQNETKPDIYYIILDGYGRADTLKGFYEFDNSEFISELNRLGFYVASDATSNYPQTLLSLASSLNFQYVEDTLVTLDPTSDDRRPLVDRIHHSHIRQIVEESGYTFVSFDTGYVTSVEDADIYYKYRGPQNTGQTYFFSMNSFESLLFEQTIVRPLIDIGMINQKYLKDTLEAPYIRHGGRVLFTFETLAQLPKMDGDYFVFVHIISPHPPFVFGKNGELISHTEAYTLGDTAENAAGTRNGTREDYIQGYTDQMTYVNSLTLKTIQTILSESETPPIIIIQGDHGPGAYLDWSVKEKTNLKDRFSILNAYYLAGRESTSLYSSISPVNTFRVVLNEFFGTHIELLPDRNFFSLW
ncbi:MAG TPA: hypothetical protein VFQ13_24250, partial [Anaerolineales bacterium]|nr:hypothetical protein [Anaerolineales bacterium]